MAVSLKNTDRSYGWVSIALHWLSASAVVVLLWDGFWLGAYQWHNSVGAMLALCWGLRLIWRFVNPAPVSLPAPRAVQRLSYLVQGSIYWSLALLIFSGLVVASEPLQPASLWGLPLPARGAQMPFEESGFYDWLHFAASLALLALVIFHVGAALKRHWQSDDNYLMRMVRPQVREQD